MTCNSIDKIIFSHKLFLTNRKVENLCKAFVNNLSAIQNYQKLNYLK